MTSRAVVLVVLCVAVAPAELPSPRAKVPAPLPDQNPLATATLAPARRYAFDGTVVEAIDAGSYVYLRVRGPAGDRWVATLRVARPLTADVTVRVIGESAVFHSSRLNRVFTGLAFGIVRAR